MHAVYGGYVEKMHEVIKQKVNPKNRPMELFAVNACMYTTWLTFVEHTHGGASLKGHVLIPIQLLDLTDAFTQTKHVI